MLTEKEFLAQEGGAILNENTINELDYQLGSVEEKTLDDYLKNIKPDNVKYYYNQYKLKRTRMACTLFAAIGLISDLYGYKFSEKEILEICDLAEKNYGWSEKTGGYLYKAIDCVRHWWNTKFPDKEVVSFRVDLLGGEFEKLLKAGKSINIGYKTTLAHYLDSQDNGKLDKECFISCGAKRTGGHSIRYNSQINIDNYYKHKKYNIYGNDKLQKLVKEGTYFRYGYVYFAKKDFETSLFKDVFKGRTFYEAIKWAKENGIVNGYNDGTFRPDKPITRAEMVGILYNYTKKYKTK